MAPASSQHANKEPSKSDSEPFLHNLFEGELAPLGLEPNPGALSAETVRTMLDTRTAAVPGELTPLRRNLLEGLLLLWHGHWDAAHSVAQDREGDPDFDLLHALAHRREGDFGNSAYWFGGAGKHPCYAWLENLPAEAWPGGENDLRRDLMPKGRWSYTAFIAEIKKAPRRDRDRDRQLRELQKLEFLAFARWILDG